MRSHDNTLYVTTQGAYLAREGTNILVRVDKSTRARFPAHTLGGIVCFGNVSCSPFAMALCANEGVSLAFLSEQGRFLSRVQGPQSGNLLLRRAQHESTSDSQMAAEVARHVVMAKVANARRVLQRAIRDHGTKLDSNRVAAAARRLGSLVRELDHPLPLERVRGVEGDAARTYFEMFDHLVVAQKKEFFFRERSRRPPRDGLNALLSFLYAILTNDVVAACEAVGLDPQMGFLHADRPGRPSLALDLVEECRAVLADRLALSLVNRRQVTGQGFERQESGAVLMKDATRKTVLTAYQERKSREVQHPFLQEKITIGILPHVQARLLARFLREDLDAYPPYFWK